MNITTPICPRCKSTDLNVENSDTPDINAQAEVLCRSCDKISIAEYSTDVDAFVMPGPYAV